MKKIVMTLSAAAALLASCETKTGTGALAGGLIGAGAGAGIGAAVGGGPGAAIGAGAGAAGGALIGGLIGSALDEQDRKNMEKNAPRTLKKIDNGEQLSIYDIKQMTNAGISDKVIISQIQATGSQFNLTSADIIDLKNAGVAQNVIDAMIQAGY
ncbi:MAG: hypothetical protein A2Y28_03985 [Chlamydiae bacterium GWC2_50_10]|nr:MAG: hypothetical protein A2Z85_02095 [Chlamydiae bacterium GWA2_50_15]OGN54408.1 MAG: hypothetical protein A2098_04990 [Chlamydiae bacterium GWF2_49_8]OGN54714.1 MAG: hypothetical protein A2Y28_03985 [Chlamydiae bacterium GWC2_50_10]OGN58071.1 MAG: hypothetical protein A3D18_03080 [Chlamydiae bacterium RIFCSPHIGHO2_02_FULL_49_29]OGN62935.1 MAG: hypothetical protein A3E26_02035 [Chlamydiae bacterium RIFCSPHIGHO2_12_FULL_49_32]OGN72141.1 MAG: hypothetical protein A3I15_01745 [Chlamydiae bact